jgi:RNA polymerase sigma-70 factor (ECF subfamily)
MRLLRSEQAPVNGQDPDARAENLDGDPSAARVDPVVAAQPTAQIGRRGPAEPSGPGYHVPVLPRPRPDEVPAPPLPEHGATDPRATARPAAQAGPPPAPPRVAEPRAARPATEAEAGQGDDTPESGVTEGNGPAGWDLVRATQAGDQQAFGQLYDRYHEMVFRYVLFRIGDRQLAEDLTAETFLRALRRIGSVSYQGRDIGAWFVTIARNLVLDHVKSSRYRLEQTTSEIADLSPATSGPEQQVLDGATHEELLRCVAKLNADQKECIALRFLQGLSVAETARLMGRNEGAVKALQHRAVRRLAQLLPEGLR